MAFINEGFLNLKDSYLFAEVARRVREYAAANPGKPVIRMGIGDVTLPLPEAVIEAMHEAVAEMGVKETFQGYPSYEGYPFLREAIAGYYGQMGVAISPDEVFVSDGAKSDAGNIGDIFDKGNTVLVTDPVYPVYVDSNVMAGRKVLYAGAFAENGFSAMPQEGVHADIIYLCSPNNPTGAVYTKEQLKQWVDYANAQHAIILFDAAYEAFVQDPALPRSIFAIEGARTCAIEICSLSKTAGFTGTRCGYTVIPKELTAQANGRQVSVKDLWYRRQSTKYNGTSYIIQRGAAAVFSKEGLAQAKANIAYYMENAKRIAKTMTELGIEFTGGTNSPYIWLKCPKGMGSWEFFDYLLSEIQVVGTPGAGFGQNGEGYFRLTAFSDKDSTAQAMERIKVLLK